MSAQLYIVYYLQNAGRRIHGGDGPIGDADGQKNKGNDGVEESGHDVADGPENRKDRIYFRSNTQMIPLFDPSTNTCLLPSFSSAMAMRSLVLRNISIIRTTASTTERVITVKQRHLKMIQRAYKRVFNVREKVVKWRRTEDEPCLAELQVDAEVCVEADVRNGDVSARLPTQAPVFPEAVPDACNDRTPFKTCLHLL